MSTDLRRDRIPALVFALVLLLLVLTILFLVLMFIDLWRGSRSFLRERAAREQAASVASEENGRPAPTTTEATE